MRNINLTPNQLNLDENLIFFKINLFQTILSGTLSQNQQFAFKIRTDILLVLTMSSNCLQMSRLGMSVTTQGGSGRQYVTGFRRNLSKYRFVLLNVYRFRET